MDSRYVNVVENFGSDGLGNPSVSIYFSHCDRKDLIGSFCDGCHNKELQENGSGYLLDTNNIIKLVELKLKSITSLFGRCSIVLVGGEPTSKLNIGMVKEISKYFYGKYEILMYTWKTYDMLNDCDIEYIDRIICGSYIEKLKVNDYLLATSNQYIINNKKEIILKYKQEDLNDN